MQALNSLLMGCCCSNDCWQEMKQQKQRNCVPQVRGALARLHQIRQQRLVRANSSPLECLTLCAARLKSYMVSYCCSCCCCRWLVSFLPAQLHPLHHDVATTRYSRLAMLESCMPAFWLLSMQSSARPCHLLLLVLTCRNV